MSRSLRWAFARALLGLLGGAWVLESGTVHRIDVALLAGVWCGAALYEVAYRLRMVRCEDEALAVVAGADSEG